MKRIIYGVTLTLCLIGFRALAQASTAPAMKLGVVNLQEALNTVDAGKKAKDTLKANYEKEQKKFEIMKKEIETLQMDYEKQRLVSSGADLKTKEDQLRTKVNTLQEALKNSQQSLATQEMQATGKILGELKTIVQELGAKENYTFIFENSQDALLYSANAENLTPKIVTLYNSKYKK